MNQFGLNISNRYYYQVPLPWSLLWPTRGESPCGCYFWTNVRLLWQSMGANNTTPLQGVKAFAVCYVISSVCNAHEL